MACRRSAPKGHKSIAQGFYEAGNAAPGGEPLPKDVTRLFQCVEGQNVGLNRRLPGTTQREVLSSGRFDYSISRVPNRQTMRWIVPGSHLLKKI